MPIAGAAQNEHLGFLFEVNFDGMKSVNFSDVDGLEHELAVIEHAEGGSAEVIQRPGRAKAKTLTLKRAQAGDFDLWNWVQTTHLQSAAGVGSSTFGLADGKYRRNGEILQKDRDGSVLARWGIRGAWPKKYTGGKWDNNADSLVMEEIVLAYDGFDRVA